MHPGAARSPPLAGVGAVQDLPALTELVTTSELVLRSLAECNFPSAARRRLPYAPRTLDTQPSEPRLPECQCFRIMTTTRDSATTVSLMLRSAHNKRQDPADDYIMFATYVANQWLYSWPAQVGPPLH